MPSIQQQSLQECALHRLPGQTANIPIARRPTHRCTFANRRYFSQHPSAKYNSCRSLSELWNYHYSIVEKRRKWSYDLQRLWYVYFVSETISPPPMLTLPRPVLQTPRCAPPRHDEEVRHQTTKARGPGNSRYSSIGH
jgi:hypothetical protein